VFGGTGFLGNRIVHHLRNHEFPVRVVSRHPDGGHSLSGPENPIRPNNDPGPGGVGVVESKSARILDDFNGISDEIADSPQHVRTARSTLKAAGEGQADRKHGPRDQL
jgi:nucleoside-diphosphate-sugar epimerase